jgi:hypothetical protein
MLLHNHESPDGDLVVIHTNREETVLLVKALTSALSNNTEGDAFSITLGLSEHLHGEITPDLGSNADGPITHLPQYIGTEEPHA